MKVMKCRLQDNRNVMTLDAAEAVTLCLLSYPYCRCGFDFNIPVE